MERALNPRLEKETIYEIYRACRLCGAGAGYKMPIMQNVVNLEDTELNLSKKIRECVQIEVHPDDKMPPLICELCVDKVNDFYEFLDMCRQTNKRTRLKLGLPMQSTPKEVPDSGDCILGDAPTVYIHDDSDGEPLSKHKSKTKPKDREKEKERVRVKKEPEVTIKTEGVSREERSRACRKPPARPPTPPVPIARVTRTSSAASNDHNTKISPTGPSKKTKPQPKSIIKKEKEDVKVKIEEDLALSKFKRLRSDKDVKPEVPAKKVKISPELIPPKSNKQTNAKSKTKPPAKRAASPARPPAPTRPSPARPQARHTPGPASRRRTSPAGQPAGPAKHNNSLSRHPAGPAKHPAKHPACPAKSNSSPVRRVASPARHPAHPASVPANQIICEICFQTIRSMGGYHSHLKIHTVTFTKPMLACNACGEWFLNYEEASNHHKRHKNDSIPYKCRRCTAEYTIQKDYEDHFGKSQCIPYDEVPDVKCEDCWRYFATDRLLIEHKCIGEDGRPGGKCPKCNRVYVLLKNLRRHESTCMHRKRYDDIIADPDVLARLMPVQIRMVKCDPLLDHKIREHYDVSNVTDFGFDRNCLYPYKMIKKEPFIGMVKIKEEIKEELCSEEYVHWDSTDSEEEVSSLVALSLKTIFSQKFLGRVPKKRRVKVELDGDKVIDMNVSSGSVDISCDGAMDVSKNASDDSFVDNSVGKSDENVEKPVNCATNQNNVTEETTAQNVNKQLNDSIVTRQLDNVGVSETEDSNNMDQQVNEGTIKLDTINGNSQTSHQKGNEGEKDNQQDHQNGELDVDQADIDDFGNETGNLNGNDTNDSFGDIDSNRLIEALNAQIGDDDEHIDGKNQNLDEKDVEQDAKEMNKEFDFNLPSQEKVTNNGENCSQEDQDVKFNHNDNRDSIDKSLKNSDSISENNEQKGVIDRNDYNGLQKENTEKHDVNNSCGGESLKKNDLENVNVAQNGGDGEKNGVNDNQNENGVEKIDKFSLEELLSKDSDKNMELDNISDDDFNFDM